MEAVAVGVCQTRVMRRVSDIQPWLDLIERQQGPVSGCFLNCSWADLIICKGTAAWR